MICRCADSGSCSQTRSGPNGVLSRNDAVRRDVREDVEAFEKKG